MFPENQRMPDLKAILSALFPTDSLCVYDCGDQTILFRQDGVVRFSVTALTNVLAAHGFILREHNEIDSVSSYTYMNADAVMIHIWYSSAERCLRTVYDPFTKKIPSEQISSAENLPVKLWQFEIDHSLIDCGMCYIFRLSDGSFFIIDSAHFYSVKDDARIISFLQKRTPEGKKIHVRGWYFSHGHADHICKAADILRYRKDIQIDAFYFNFIDLSLARQYAWDPADLRFEQNFRALVTESGIPVFKLHTLQQIHFPGLAFTVLLTHEDVFPASLEDYNNSSSVISVCVGKDKILFPGDASGESSPILEKRFSASLRCDILQQAHHGHFGLSDAFYRAADASVLLSPTTRIKYDEEFPRFTANQTAAALAKYVFIASEGTVEFTFPLQDHKICRLPDEIFEDFDGILNLWNYSYPDAYKNKLYADFLNRQSTENYDLRNL